MECDALDRAIQNAVALVGLLPKEIGTILADSRIAFRSLPVGSPFVPLPPRNIPPSAVHLSSTADYTAWHQWIIGARMTGCSSERHSGKRPAHLGHSSLFSPHIMKSNELGRLLVPSYALANSMCT